MRTRLATLLALTLALLSNGCASSGYDKPGFYTEVVDGRLWVFSEEAERDELRRSGEPTRCFQWIHAGPDGMTLRGKTKELLVAYLNQSRRRTRGDG